MTLNHLGCVWQRVVVVCVCVLVGWCLGGGARRKRLQKSGQKLTQNDLSPAVQGCTQNKTKNKSKKE
jgi:hypothetical protein